MPAWLRWLRASKSSSSRKFLVAIISRADLYFSGFFFFFKQKTAYEISECDWSSDVCSSDLSLDDFGNAQQHNDVREHPDQPDQNNRPVNVPVVVQFHHVHLHADGRNEDV